jgi:4-amino-4-deoxy-L-arabinose transferase-like glycosyltransferase
VQRIAGIIAGLACVFFALAAGWGIGGPIGAGHYAAMTSEGIMAENMWRYHILGPVWWYPDRIPTPADYYCHHPWGLFYITAILYKLLGHRDFILPLPALVMSTATPVLIYKMASEHWGRLPATAAVVSYVLLPITLGYANFHSLEGMVICGFSLSAFCLLRWLGTGRRLYLFGSLAGTLMATAADWPGYVAIGGLLLCGLYQYCSPCRTSPDGVPIAKRRYASWWLLTALLLAVMLLGWLGLFHYAGQLQELFASARRRGLGDPTPLHTVLSSRRFWIELAFTPPVIFLGKLALPVAIFRFLQLRKLIEGVSLSIFLTAVLQYVAFKGGADVHFFWPQYFGLYFALAAAQLLATLLAGAAWLAERAPKAAMRGRLAASIRSAAAPGCLLLVLALLTVLLPDALRTLRYARITGGRYNEKGARIRSDADLIEVARWLRPRLPPEAVVGLDPTLKMVPRLGTGWHLAWALQARTQSLALPLVTDEEQGQPGFFMARLSALPGERLPELFCRSHARIFGDIVVVDTHEPPGPLDAYSFHQREPGLWRWYFVSGVEPEREIGPDAAATWEWRLHLGQPPAEFPRAAPAKEDASLEWLRLAHNHAVATGQKAEAESLLAQLRARLDASKEVRFSQGIHLLGTRVTTGVHPLLEVFLQAKNPVPGDVVLHIHSRVEAKAPYSLIPPDPTERDCAYPASLPSRYWRPGFIYRIESSLLKRIGKERFFGFFTALPGQPAPIREDGLMSSDLAIVP